MSPACTKALPFGPTRGFTARRSARSRQCSRCTSARRVAGGSRAVRNRARAEQVRGTAALAARQAGLASLGTSPGRCGQIIGCQSEPRGTS